MDAMTEGAARHLLGRNFRGTMALAEGGYAYAFPVFYAFDGQRLYFHSHPGLKDRFLTATAEACFNVVEYDDRDDWRSVQCFGRVEKITLSDDAMEALDALSKIPLPPEYGVDAAGGPKRSAERMYLWMMVPARISGRASRSGAERPARPSARAAADPARPQTHA